MKKQYGPLISVFVLALLLATSPLTGFAKENSARSDDHESKAKIAQGTTTVRVLSNTRDDEDANDRVEDSNSRVGSSTMRCLTAFGHLIAPGWIKNKENVPWNHCYLPAGIAKKLGTTTPSSGGTTTQHTFVAPTINKVTFPSVLVTGQIGTFTISASDPQSRPLSYAVNFGESGIWNMWWKGSFVATSTFTHAYANPGTYTVTFSVRDSLGLVTKTAGTVVVLPGPAATTSAPVVTNIGLSLASSTAPVVSWTTDTTADSRVWVSTTTPVNTTISPSFLNSTLSTSHSVSLNGLATSTTYHIVVGSQDSSNRLSTSTSFTLSL